MYDYAWKVQNTEFDIVEEGDVPLLMSLPQMRNLGFHFELTPENAYLSCERIGMRKLKLKTAVSTHLIFDLHDLAWYMSDVIFQTPTIKSFFSQRDHFEYSQIMVQQDVGESLVSQDYWEVDPMRREMIRHHREVRKALHEMTLAKNPIPREQLLDERETHIEYKNGKKFVHKDKWNEKRPRAENRFEQPWKGKSIYKIKQDYVIPESIVQSNLDKNTKYKGDIKDEMFRASSSKDKKSSSLSKEVDKKTSKPSSFDKEVGSEPADHSRVYRYVSGKSPRRRLTGKQEEKGLPTDVDRSHELGEEFEEMMQDGKPDSVPVQDVPFPESSMKGPEVKKVEPGDGSLEPRRLAVPLPGSEVQAMTPAFQKMLKKLDDSVELYKLHVKHYHMSPTQCRRRTSMLSLPDSIYKKYEDVVHKCRVCSTSIAPPYRAKISGIRASNFGDIIFVDHAEIGMRKNKYIVLLVLDGATNLLWATAQPSLNNKDTIRCLSVGDEAFFTDGFLTYYRTHGIKEYPCGARTPWPNRAETAVRLLKRQWELMSKSLEDDRFKGVTVCEAVKKTVWARNAQLTISGYSPLEIATGRRPPDLLDVETSDPAQLSVEPLEEDRTMQDLQRLWH